MAKNNPIEPMTLTPEEQAAVVEVAAPVQVDQAVIVAIPKTDEERAALEYELTNYSRKTAAKMAGEEAAVFHTRRYHICLALRGIVYDRATVPIPEREQERAALEHELENPSYYPPKKIVEVMTRQEQNGYYIRRRQIMFALRGEPDDTTPAAKDVVRGCCK